MPVSPAAEYKRRLHDLLVERLDFGRVAAYRDAAANERLRLDLTRAAEHVTGTHLGDVTPAGAGARAARAEVAAAIVAGVAPRDSTPAEAAAWARDAEAVLVGAWRAWQEKTRRSGHTPSDQKSPGRSAPGPSGRG